MSLDELSRRLDAGDHGLSEGDPLGGPLFPQVWPHAIPAEVARRMEGPEPPSPTQLKAFAAHLEETGFGKKGGKRSL